MTLNQMLINYLPGEECRVAVLEDGRLEEFHTEKAGSVTFVGNIYVGRVTNVEPSIQAAFVDFGLESNGFLHVTDVHPMYFPGAEDDATEQIGKKTPRRERPPIQQCLRRGQEIVVQVLKEGINTKGPTLTSYLSIPGRYLVMLPDMDRVGVSRKVEDDDQRREMKAALDQLELPEGFGFIMRTAGEGRGKMELKRDLAYLQRLWKDIERRRKGGDKPRLLYAESDLMMRALRDIWTTDIHEIVIDNESALRRASRFMKIVAPRGATKLLHYNRTAPLFHAFGVEEQIARTHAREVPLPSGGSLVIDETEAMIAIDVNSGKMRSHGDAETTAYKTNVEAVDEICRQLRLRDVGGLVLCDLIDMMSRSHRRDIENRMKDRFKKDRAATKVLPISEFGIVEVTRQRQKQSLRKAHYAECPECSGRGVLKRPDSVADDAMRDLAAILEHEKVSKVELLVSPRVAGELLSHKRQSLGRLEYSLKKHVDVRVNETIPMDRVDFFAYDAAGADVELDRLPRPKPPRDLPEWIDESTTSADWSMDSQREAAEVPAELVQLPSEAEEAALPTDELMLSDDLSLDSFESKDQAAAGADGEQGGAGRKRRRRRRGRGGRGGGAGEGDGAPPQQPQRAPQQAQQPAERGPDEAGAPGADGEQTGTGRKRRRRRRRGRGGRGGGEGAPAGEGVPQGAEFADAGESVGAPGSRGDSWDLPAEAVMPRSHPVEAAANHHDSAADGELSDHEGDDGAPVHDGVPEHGEQQGAGGGAGGGKKKRRRRGRRGRGGKGREDGARPEGGGPPPSAPAHGGGGGGRGEGRPARPAQPSAPPAVVQTRAAAPAAGSGAGGAAAPKRTLYGFRRKLGSSEASALKGKRDE